MNDIDPENFQHSLKPQAQGVKISSVATGAGATATDVAPAVESPRGAIVSPKPGIVGSRLVPLAVASALFMEFVDSTALSTALPTLAKAFQSDPVHLKLALTSYLLALAVFAPASGWVADRFGARRVFLVAMAVFLLGSMACGISNSLPQLVLARILQGVGGAMMTPVGRVIVVNTAPKERLVSAMAWFTMPALIGPLIGPAISGFILDVADWRWIFFVNIPVGILGMLAVVSNVPSLVSVHPGRFDTWGFLLTGIGITAMVIFAETTGVSMLPWWLQVLLALLAVTTLTVYVRHACKIEKPILNLGLLKVASFRASMLGGTLVRLGLGATPFLLPLLLQIGLGWSPIKAGMVTISTAVGALTCKPLAAPLLRRFGFRRVLVFSVLGTAVLTAIPAVYRLWTPIWFMLLTLMIGGFFRSMQFTSTNSMAYADIEKQAVSQASTLATVTQQIGMSFGVSFGALLLHFARGANNGALTPERFVFPFIVIGAITLLAIPVYWRLNPKTGANIIGR